MSLEKVTLVPMLRYFSSIGILHITASGWPASIPHFLSWSSYLSSVSVCHNWRTSEYENPFCTQVLKWFCVKWHLKLSVFGQFRNLAKSFCNHKIYCHLKFFQWNKEFWEREREPNTSTSLKSCINYIVICYIN